MSHELTHLIELAKGGDHQAFAEIVKLKQQQVYRYCYPMIGNHHDAEDVVQETFVVAYQKFSSYREIGQFTGWLLTIAHRTCLNRLKADSRFRSLLQKMRSVRATESDYYPSLHSNDEVLSMLKRLSPNARSVVVLKVLHDMTYEEIREIVGIPSNVLRKRFERAKKQLQTEADVHQKQQIKGRMKYEC